MNAERCRPPLPEGEVERIARDIATRYQPEPPDFEREELAAEVEELLIEEKQEQPQPGSGRRRRAAIFLPFSDVKLSGPIRWTWKGRIPENAVTLLAGRPKIGKSLLTVYLAAQLSRGLLEGAYLCIPSKSLLVAAEDPVDPVIKGRLIAATAEESFVGSLASRPTPSRPPRNAQGKDGGLDQDRRNDPRANAGGLGGLDGFGAFTRRIVLPDELDLVEALVVENEIRLVVLDPLNSFLSAKVDAHRDTEIRRVLDPLGALAARHHFAALAVVHLNRRSDRDILSRIIGSGGYGGSARSILTFGVNPENDDQRAVASEGNWQKEDRSQLFEIRSVVVFPDAEPEEQTQPALVHVGESDLGAADLLEQLDEDRGAIEEAKTWLMGELAFGPAPVNDLQRGAEANGIAWRTAERAKRLLGIEARRISSTTSPRGSGRWEWVLPLADEEQPE